MATTIDFKQVSTAGLESSPHAEALAGLRANEARYFKNKYDHEFTVLPASGAEATIQRVHLIRDQERDIILSSRPLQATAFEVDNVSIASASNESGLSVSVMCRDAGRDKRAYG